MRNQPFLVMQPAESKICGHCCVAMAAGLNSPRRVIDIIGHTGGTNSPTLIKALRSLEVPVADKLRLIKPNKTMPPVAIIGTRPTKKTKGFYGHWIFYYYGKVFCPFRGIFQSLNQYFSVASHLRPTAYLEIYQR